MFGSLEMRYGDLLTLTVSLFTKEIFCCWRRGQQLLVMVTRSIKSLVVTRGLTQFIYMMFSDVNQLLGRWCGSCVSGYQLFIASCQQYGMNPCLLSTRLCLGTQQYVRTDWSKRVHKSICVSVVIYHRSLTISAGEGVIRSLCKTSQIHLLLTQQIS